MVSLETSRETRSSVSRATARDTVPFVSVVVPTYNEKDNVGPLSEQLHAALESRYQYEVIFVDDGSPDGTGDIIRQIAKTDPHVRIIQRGGKAGLGSAVVAGFQTARGNLWAMMDADLSHRPQDLVRILQTMEAAPSIDIAVGSRYVTGGGVQNWPLFRRVASRGASLLARQALGIPVKDLTSGFALFRKEAVEPILPRLNPRGFKLMMEIVAKSRGVQVTEVPILFVERVHGQSKFGRKEVLAFLRLILTLRRERATADTAAELAHSGAQSKSRAAARGE